MSAFDEKPLLTPATLQEWIGYLEGTPDPGGVRVRLRKKRAAVPGITYDEALDVALCFGWIDGQIKGLDEQYHLQLFTPRRRGSMWSQRNREYIERLTAAGLMREQDSQRSRRQKPTGDGMPPTARRMPRFRLNCRPRSTPTRQPPPSSRRSPASIDGRSSFRS